MNKAQLQERSHLSSLFDKSKSMKVNNGMNLDTSNSPRLLPLVQPLVQPFCQGVIVSNEWVLTHADCNGFQYQNLKKKIKQLIKNHFF